ncbi:hypothetical protein MPH_13856 [Macrophomina phaseolina MS6]|uniref:Uncharacterized protein n=1 Tax=Macrophomina phaseolina (strain MS6) TaxID=1126212 RepID=K2RXK8_MACPH|nr:hypothetical protein MPH_13856 [Macrophomina phaseolina MS6]
MGRALRCRRASTKSLLTRTLQASSIRTYAGSTTRLRVSSCCACLQYCTESSSTASSATSKKSLRGSLVTARNYAVLSALSALPAQPRFVSPQTLATPSGAPTPSSDIPRPAGPRSCSRSRTGRNAKHFPNLPTTTFVALKEISRLSSHSILSTRLLEDSRPRRPPSFYGRRSRLPRAMRKESRVSIEL